jgi:hypothetical protein
VATEKECEDLAKQIEKLFPRNKTGYEIFEDDDTFVLNLVSDDEPSDALKSDLNSLLKPKWTAEWAFFEHRRWRCRITPVK